jgi:hypothetical protein
MNHPFTHTNHARSCRTSSPHRLRQCPSDQTDTHQKMPEASWDRVSSQSQPQSPPFSATSQATIAREMVMPGQGDHELAPPPSPPAPQPSNLTGCQHARTWSLELMYGQLSQASPMPSPSAQPVQLECRVDGKATLRSTRLRWPCSSNRALPWSSCRGLPTRGQLSQAFPTRSPSVSAMHKHPVSQHAGIATSARQRLHHGGCQ